MEFRNLYRAYEFLCTEYADHVLFANGRITYRETWERVRRRGAFLLSQGLKEGDSIGLLSVNSPDWCITFMAITAIGALAVPLDTNLPREQHLSMLPAADVRALCVSAEFQDREGVVPVFEIGPGLSEADGTSFRGADPEDSAVASLLFTSGTTGSPKIVMLTHRNFIRTTMAINEFETHFDETQLAILPLFHVYAFVATFLSPLFSKSTIVYQTSLKGPDIMNSLQRNPVTVFPAAPIMWEMFFDGIANKLKAESMAKYRFFMFIIKIAPVMRKIGLGFIPGRVFAPVHEVFGRTHKFFISGGAPMKREYFDCYKGMGFNIMEGYGLTETTGPVAIPFYAEGKAGWVGPPVHGNEVKLANVNDEGIGEICLRGDSISPGYYKNPEATAAAYDSEGFFHTGDLGRLDGNGHISITGRLKNVIVLDSGKNVYPEELEFYYRNSPLVAEIAVLSRRMDGRETLYAVIVPSKRNGEVYQQVKDEIHQMNSGLPEYRRVYNFALSFDPLPRNSTRKLLYREIVDALDQGFYQTHEEDSAILRTLLVGKDPAEERIIEVLKRRLKTDKLFAGATMADFSIDSLGFVDLCVYLEEKLSITLDVETLKSKQTMAEMVTFLSVQEKTGGSSIDDYILTGPYMKKAYPFFNPMHHLTLNFLRFLSRRFWRLEVVNPELMDLENTLIVGNHSSYLDAIFVGVAIPSARRKNIYAAGKEELWFLKYIFPMFPFLTIEQGNTLNSLKINADILRQGKSIIIFPEGGRSDDGSLQPFKSGAAYLAKKLNVNVIPIRIDGAYEIWPRGKRWPRLSNAPQARLTVLKPLDPADYPTIDDLTAAMEKVLRPGQR